MQIHIASVSSIVVVFVSDTIYVTGLSGHLALTTPPTLSSMSLYRKTAKTEYSKVDNCRVESVLAEKSSFFQCVRAHVDVCVNVPFFGTKNLHYKPLTVDFKQISK